MNDYELALNLKEETVAHRRFFIKTLRSVWKCPKP